MHEWFRTFCELHEPADAGAGWACAAREGGEERRRVGEGGGGRGGRQERRRRRGGGARKGPREREKGTEKGTREGTFGLEKRRCWELQARFTRAAAELEFLGVARPVKRRKVEYMQRTAFPLDQLLGESR